MSAVDYEAKQASDRQHALNDGPTSSVSNLYAVGDASKDDATTSPYNSLASPTHAPPPSVAVASHADAVNNIFAQLDNHALSWFHIKTVIVAGMGFFCDSYDLFSISLVTQDHSAASTTLTCDLQLHPAAEPRLRHHGSHRLLRQLPDRSLATSASSPPPQAACSTWRRATTAKGTGWADP